MDKDRSQNKYIIVLIKVLARIVSCKNESQSEGTIYKGHSKTLNKLAYKIFKNPHHKLLKISMLYVLCTMQLQIFKFIRFNIFVIGLLLHQMIS